MKKLNFSRWSGGRAAGRGGVLLVGGAAFENFDFGICGRFFKQRAGVIYYVVMESFSGKNQAKTTRKKLTLVFFLFNKHLAEPHTRGSVHF